MGTPAPANFLNDDTPGAEQKNDTADLVRDLIFTPFLAGMFQGFLDVGMTQAKKKWAARQAAKAEAEKASIQILDEKTAENS